MKDKGGKPTMHNYDKASLTGNNDAGQVGKQDWDSKNRPYVQSTNLTFIQG